MRPRLITVPLFAMLSSTPAWAESHGVTVVNNAGETIRRIEIGTGDNRLRSQLPPGAQARITYSTGCQADVRLGYESGRTEAFAAIDICSDPRIVAGQGATAANAAPSTPSHAASKPATVTAPTSVAATSPVKAPPPVVPPWTGKSITKRFGGME